MELTFKQKVVVFGVMLGIFMCSVFIKQWIDGKQTAVNDVSGAEGLATAEASVEADAQGSKGSAAAAEYELVLDVEGAVVYPGIVKVPEGSRVYEAIEKAGGLLDTADTKYVNLAEEVSDGSIIYIPFEGENEKEGETSSSSGGTSSSGININTADKSELMELPGIGEAYAQAIIDYRETKGKFKSKEDIKNVSGIGDAKFEKIESLICVY